MEIANARRDWRASDDRAEAAEAKLARVVEALEVGLEQTKGWSDVGVHNYRNLIRAALAAAKGE